MSLWSQVYWSLRFQEFQESSSKDIRQQNDGDNKHDVDDEDYDNDDDDYLSKNMSKYKLS